MTCEPTQTPDDIDIPALREKYRQERDKRLRPEGQKQYLRTADDFADQYEVDPHMPVVPGIRSRRISTSPSSARAGRASWPRIT